MKVAALIPAAGSGTRLALGPKAFVDVGGRSLLARSVACLAPHVDELVIALPEGARPELFSPVPVKTVLGGQTRQASVLNLLRATDADVVLIHDAARPFLPERVIREVAGAAAQFGAATAALPVADTLVRAGDAADHWGSVVPRADMWAVQTPQGFRRGLLLEAHLNASRDGFEATDDAGLIARAGGQVRLVRGDARLFKVTTPGDLTLAEALAQVWDRPHHDASGDL